MLDWLVPICAFFAAASLYLGGMADVEGGSGFKQVLGLILTFIIYLAGWYVIRLATGGMLGFFGAFVVPTILTIALLPVWSRIGFKVVGSGVTSAAAHH